MGEAGFFLTATEAEPDKVTCYACGVEKAAWKLGTADPWLEHQRLSPDCKYLELRKKAKMELTVNDFLAIERYRVHRINVMIGFWLLFRKYGMFFKLPGNFFFV
jgi:hypothetical protein